MRKYEDGYKGELIQVVCNQCKRALKLEKGYLREGCFSADFVFGYFSEKDGMRQQFDLCEACYRKITAGFQIPVEESEANELL